MKCPIPGAFLDENLTVDLGELDVPGGGALWTNPTGSMIICIAASLSDVVVQNLEGEGAFVSLEVAADGTRRIVRRTTMRDPEAGQPDIEFRYAE